VHGKLGSLCPCIKGLLARLAAQVYNPQDIPSSYTTQTHLLYTNISSVENAYVADRYRFLRKRKCTKWNGANRDSVNQIFF
jgi:hypothetical protein